MTCAMACTAVAQVAQPTGTPVVTADVQARGETRPVASGKGDAADDPAIWRNRHQPRRSLIVATDKKAGLYAYGLDGRIRDYSADGRLNNVDLLDMGRHGVIVVASDRNDPARAALRLYRLDTTHARLRPLGTVPGGMGEAYGVCLMPAGRGLHAFSVLKDGTIAQVAIRLTRNGARGRVVRHLQLASQSEGCVVDPRSRTLFVGEEDRGIWAFDARANGARQGRLFAPVDQRHLFADVEGLAIMPRGRHGGWLIASSQGDNAYALFRLRDGQPAGRFRIAAGRFGATQETDGIAAAAGHFGRQYRHGLFIAQDGDNAPDAQNFKLVSWADIRRALRRAH
ncbi:phytase [Novosphingobium sp. FSY-8]|uniref:Phytase n=2 Tax=Novosphingobium ovatum TaxID=1908523 RepID=A0ABW9X9P8_9SPHN|nr:phytase [Novosphingobium ovatum]